MIGMDERLRSVVRASVELRSKNVAQNDIFAPVPNLHYERLGCKRRSLPKLEHSPTFVSNPNHREKTTMKLEYAVRVRSVSANIFMIWFGL